MLRQGPASRGRGPYLHFRVHILPRLRQRCSGWCMPELRWQLFPATCPAGPSARKVPRFFGARLQGRRLCGGLTIRSSRCRFAARLDSGVGAQMKHLHLVVIASFCVAACTSSPSTEPAFLPQLDPPPPGFDEIRLTALSSGTLEVVRGCVRVAHGGASRFTTVLWHQGTELDRDGSGYFLRNAHTGTIYRFGQRIEFGGGTAPREWIERRYPETARRCGPPYASGWLPG